MSSISDDDYSNSSYRSTTVRCNQCNKKILAEDKLTPSIAKKKKTKHLLILLKFNIFKCLFVPCQCRRRRNKLTTADEEYCSCSIPWKSSESITFVDYQQQQQPWIVPSDYHKNILSSVPHSPSNQWIFRTGWTPQPDPLASINNGWCSHYGSCVKKDLIQCPSCDIEPLVITTRYNKLLTGIDEDEKIRVPSSPHY